MSPVLTTVGNFNVYAFGFFLSLAFLFSTFIVWKNAKEELKEDKYLDAFLYTSIVAIISARVTYIILHFNSFGINILKYIVVREQPGLSLLGGIFGGVVYLYWYSRSIKEDYWKILDLFALSGSFALFLAKIGEQLGGGSFGKETNSFLGVKIAGLTSKHHPVEFYEAVLFLALTIILYFVYQRVKRKIYPPGTNAFIFGLGLAVIIFSLEFMKVYSIYLYGLSVKQITAMFIFISMSVPLLKRLKVFKRKSL